MNVPLKEKNSLPSCSTASYCRTHAEWRLLTSLSRKNYVKKNNVLGFVLNYQVKGE